MTNDRDRSRQEGRRRFRRVVIEERQRNTLHGIRDNLGLQRRRRSERLRPGHVPADQLAQGARPAAARRVRHAGPRRLEALDGDGRLGLSQSALGGPDRQALAARCDRGRGPAACHLCRPVWAAIAAQLRTYGGVGIDPGAEGIHARGEARRVNELDWAELDQVVQYALLEALVTCRPFPRRFFPWLKGTLSFRALDHVRADIAEHSTLLPHDDGIKEVVDAVLADRSHPAAAFYACPASPAHTQWLRPLDIAELFNVADEYAIYTRTRTACERAVDRLPTRQGEVIRDHCSRAMTQERIAQLRGVAASTVRNSHSKALGKLRRDDELFAVLAAVGKVRGRARREKLKAERQAA
jgi:RNA polymerase sigma factor (sigma-70 family)